MSAEDAEAPPFLRPSCAPAGARGLAWSGVGFSVPAGGALQRLPGRAGGATKAILAGSSGLVRPGEVLYILGPSGSGKSSTLDSLAMRVAAQVRGRVWVDGRAREEGEWRARAKYVEQEDHLFEVLSAVETLEYAAKFQVGEARERGVRVRETMERLGLGDAAETKVGGTFFRGLSGGQRRRVAIGCELVAKPDVLLLDEPTSGLDSASALKVMEHLKDSAGTGVAVVATVHQPSRQIWELADKVLLLAGGRTVYFGERGKVLEYFEKQGSVLPPRTSVPDFLLDEINADFFEDKSKVQRLVDAWGESVEKKQLDLEIDSWVDGGKAGDGLSDDSSGLTARITKRGLGCGRVQYKRSMLEQVSILASRNLKDAFRNPGVIYLRFAMYFALVVLIGIVWFRVPAQADRIQSLLGALFYANAFLVFMSISVLPVYLNERRIVTRERLNGSYSIGAYLLGHFVVEAIMLGVLSLSITAILYSMVSLHPAVDRAFFWALTLWLSLLVAESIVILLASIVPVFIVGIALGALLFGAFLAVQGFYTHVKFIPWPVRWLGYLDLYSYSFAAMVINEFDGRTYVATPNSSPPFLEDVDGKSVIDSFDFISNNRWVNIGVMVLMLIAYRGFAYVCIANFHNGKK